MKPSLSLPLTIALAAVPLLGGCVTVQAGVGPSLDTGGRVGVEGRLSATVGLGDGDGYLGVGSYMGVAELGEEGEDTTITYGGQLHWNPPEKHARIIFHADLLIGGRSSVGLDENLFGVGLEFGVGYDLLGYRRRIREAVILGVALRSEYMSGREGRAMFTLPLFIEFLPITPFTRSYSPMDMKK